MELLELSRESLSAENKKLYELVSKDYDYDLVIFVARGSYGIGLDLAALKGVPVTEVFASRKGGRLKKLLRPALKAMPKGLKSFLRKKEFNSGVHEKNSEREVSFDEKVWERHRSSERILLVDDSVDTGYSIKSAREEISNYFEGAEVRVAALNVFEKSKAVTTTDYSLYSEKMLLGPWSNDSPENKEYLAAYTAWHNKQ